MGKASASKSAKDKAKPPPAKKTKLEIPIEDAATTSGTPSLPKDFLTAIGFKREKCAENVLKFKFNKKRCRLLSKSMDIGDNGGGILYWMSRDQRVQGL